MPSNRDADEVEKAFVTRAQLMRAGARDAGQVPRFTIPPSLTDMPKPVDFAQQRLDFTEPVMRVEAVTKGLPLEPTKAAAFQKFVSKALGSKNEVEFRTQVMQQLHYDMKADPVMRKALFQRSLSLWNRRGAMQKSESELEKAEPRGGSYHRRVTDPDTGKHRYYYSEDDYAKRNDAHVSGADARKAQAKKAVLATVGDAGCTVDSLKNLSGKFDEGMLADIVRGCVDAGELTHNEGKLMKTVVKQQVQKAMNNAPPKPGAMPKKDPGDAKVEAEQEKQANADAGLSKAAGPFIGPKGGKYADAAHKIPWAEPGESRRLGGVAHTHAALESVPQGHGVYPPDDGDMPATGFVRHGDGWVKDVQTNTAHGPFASGQQGSVTLIDGGKTYTTAEVHAALAPYANTARGDLMLVSNAHGDDDSQALLARHRLGSTGTMQKSEGARGGHVIGHTASGKPIYAPKDDYHAKVKAHRERGTEETKNAKDEHELLHAEKHDFTPAEHHEAARVHDALEGKHYGTPEGEMHRQMKVAHMNVAGAKRDGKSYAAIFQKSNTPDLAGWLFQNNTETAMKSMNADGKMDLCKCGTAMKKGADGMCKACGKHMAKAESTGISSDFGGNPGSTDVRAVVEIEKADDDEMGEDEDLEKGIEAGPVPDNEDDDLTEQAGSSIAPDGASANGNPEGKKTNLADDAAVQASDKMLKKGLHGWLSKAVGDEDEDDGDVPDAGDGDDVPDGDADPDMEKAEYIKREGTPGHYKYTYADHAERAKAASDAHSEAYGHGPRGVVRNRPDRKEGMQLAQAAHTAHAEAAKAARAEGKHAEATKHENTARSFLPDNIDQARKMMAGGFAPKPAKEKAPAKKGGDMAKSEGEGSRGGHIVGHTGSGKPIYESSSGGGSHAGYEAHAWAARDAHLSGRYKEAAAHHAVAAHLTDDPKKKAQHTSASSYAIDAHVKDKHNSDGRDADPNGRIGKFRSKALAEADAMAKKAHPEAKVHNVAPHPVYKVVGSDKPAPIPGIIAAKHIHEDTIAAHTAKHAGKGAGASVADSGAKQAAADKAIGKVEKSMTNGRNDMDAFQKHGLSAWMKSNIPGADDTSAGQDPIMELPEGVPDDVDQGSNVNGPMLALAGMNAGNRASGGATGQKGLDAAASGSQEKLNDDDPDADEMQSGAPYITERTPEKGGGSAMGVGSVEQPGPASGGPRVGNARGESGGEGIPGTSGNPSFATSPFPMNERGVGGTVTLNKSTRAPLTREEMSAGNARMALVRERNTPQDVTVGVGRAAPRPQAPQGPQATTIRKGEVVYSNAADLAVDALMKGGGEAPTLDLRSPLVKSVGCPACGSAMPGWASRCPECGVDAGGSLQKSVVQNQPAVRRPGIGPRVSADIVAPGGVRLPKT